MFSSIEFGSSIFFSFLISWNFRGLHQTVCTSVGKVLQLKFRDGIGAPFFGAPLGFSTEMYLFLCRDAKVVMDPLRRRIRCHRSCSVKERRSSLFSLLAEKVIIYSLRTKQTDLHYDSYPFRTSSCHAPEPTPKKTTTPPPVDPTPTVVPLITVSPERNLLEKLTLQISLSFFAFRLDWTLSDSNSNGSYYYSNDNGSSYYNSGSGSSTYTSPSGSKTSK